MPNTASAFPDTLSKATDKDGLSLPERPHNPSAVASQELPFQTLNQKQPLSKTIPSTSRFDVGSDLSEIQLTEDMAPSENPVWTLVHVDPFQML